jgi:hypothetical protein
MRTLLLVLAATALGFAPAPLPRPDRGRSDRNLDGIWVLKQVKYVGSTDYLGAGLGSATIYLNEEVTITAREMRVKPRDPKLERQRLRIPIEVQTAERLDLLQTQDLRTRALYRVQGTTLTIAYPVSADRPRPTSFDNPNEVVIVFERVRR